VLLELNSNAPEDNYSIMKNQLQNFLKKNNWYFGVRLISQISPVLVSTSNRNQAPLKAIKSAE
jgi:hypothetical protein